MALDERRGSPSTAREPVDRRERRRWLLALLLLSGIAVALRWPALNIGLLSDDYMQHAMLEDLYPGQNYAPFDLYAFVRADAELAAHVDEGTVPWFAEPEFHGAVFRPLASALLWLDHVIAPGRVRLWHGHSLLWFGLSVLSFGACARRLLPRWPAALAVVLYACEAGFVSPLGWLANRCVIVCAALGFAAIFVHLEWRRPDPATPGWLRRGGPVVELGLLAGCLSAGEYGLGIVAYLFAWEALVGGQDASTPGDRWTTRARALLPAGIATASYLALHELLGYGAFGADVYADPLHEPIGWLRWANYRLPKLGTGALWSVPGSSIHVFRHPGAAWWQALWPVEHPFEVHRSHRLFGLIGIAVAALGFVLARAGLHEDERRTLRAVLVGGFLGLLPVSVAPAHSRLLIVAQIAACVSVSLLVFACGRLLVGRRGTGWARARGTALLPFAAVMLVAHVYWDLRWSHRYLLHLDGVQESNVMAFTEGDLLDQELGDREVLVLNGPSQSTGMYGQFVLHANGRTAIPASWRPLGLGGDHAIFAYRPSADTLELTAIQGAWLQTAGELFFRRADQLLPAGSRFDYPGMDVEVLADEDGHPTRVRFRFPRSLDDPRYLFLTCTKTGLNRWELPPVRGSAVVPLPGLPFPEHLMGLSVRRGVK